MSGVIFDDIYRMRKRGVTWTLIREVLDTTRAASVWKLSRSVGRAGR
jgi:hypothetical protein